MERIMSALTRAITECWRTGKPQQLTVEEGRNFVQEMETELRPKIEKIRREQRIGYAACKNMVLD